MERTYSLLKKNPPKRRSGIITTGESAVAASAEDEIVEIK